MALKTLGILALVGFAAFGCDDLDEFKTSRGTVFRGDVVGSDSDPEQSSFIRQGFPSHTRMELDFDPDATGVSADSHDVHDPERAPGRVHTYTCPADESECEGREGTPGPFDRARLEPIENLTHDPLSEYTFPGFGRLRNYMFNVRFESQPENGDDALPIRRNAMLFLSLLDTGKVEVRALSPSVLSADGESDEFSALFGVFILDRQSR